MNLDKIKPETLAAGVMDYMPQSLAAHEYAERLNAALARLGLTERLTLPPAPATAIDELPAVVDVPLRKTLSVLMGKAEQGDASALATLELTAQVTESIFAGLHARASVYPLALPSHESFATLPQGVDALLPRKISNGAWSLLADGTPSDGIDDGMSLVRLLCSDAGDKVTEIKDDNEGWVMSRQMGVRDCIANFPQAQVFHFNCRKVTSWQCNGNARAVTLIFDNCTEIPSRFIGESANNGLNTQCPNFIVYIYGLKTTNNSENNYGTIYAGEFYLPDYEQGVWRVGGSGSYCNSCTKKIYVGCKGNKSDTIRFWHYYEQSTVTDFEIGEGACQNITISNLVGLTAENIYNHILCRLKQDEPMCGEGVTITLGTTNIDKIEAVEEYNLKLTELTDIYGYTFA